MRKYLIMLQIFTAWYFTAASQNVGIGITTPTEKLHVAGNIKGDTVKPNAIRLTPNAGAGKMLTSDAAGNASWQERNTGGSVGFGTWGDCSMNGVSEYNPITDAEGAPLNVFGNSTSLSGNFAIVGSRLDEVEGNVEQGTASIYQYNGTSWVFMQKLNDELGFEYEYFGTSVSISGNFAIVGAPGSNSFQGSASIYQYNGGAWVLMQKITDATGAGSDGFGSSVSVSGNYAIVGSPNDDNTFSDQGSACIFQFNGLNWVLMQKIIFPNSDPFDYFGYSVSISGNFAIIGAPQDDVGANANQGSVNIYTWGGGSNWILMQTITDATGGADDFFGYSVSISGNYAIVGAFLDDTGAGTNTNEGSVSIYQRNGISWTLMEKITDPAGSANDNFGYSVSISGNYAIVGAYHNDVDAKLDQGTVNIYMRVGPGWQKLQTVIDPGGRFGDMFGVATAIDSNTQRFIIGAEGYKGFWGKVVFGKVN